MLAERPDCPVCGRPPGATLYRCAYADSPIRDYLFRFYPSFTEDDLARLGDGVFVLERCSSCSTVWQRFAPEGELLTRLYETWAADGGALERHDDAPYHRAAAEEVLLVQQLVGRRPSEIAVLDFGMGWGRWPRLAAAFGMRAHGVELARHQAEWAAAQGVTVVELDHLPEGSFDFVNSEQVFEHLVDPRGTLQRLARSLTPGGWLKIAVPDASGIAERLRDPDWSSRALNPVAPLEHLNAFDQDALTELGRQAGLVRAAPAPHAVWSSTIGLWPPRRLARGLVRPVARRVAPGAAFFRRVDSSPLPS